MSQITKVYGLRIDIPPAVMGTIYGIEKIKADHKAQVAVRINGIEKQMTLKEFIRRIFRRKSSKVKNNK